jgi:hypothetical protein
MKKLAVTTALAVFLTSACTTTRQVRRPANLADFEARMPRQRDRVTLLSARPPEATSALPPLPVAGDVAPAAGAGVPLVDISNLRGYEVKNRAFGSLEGLGIGILVGGLVGFAIGSAFGSDGPCTNDDGGCVMFSAADKGFVFGALGAWLGSMAGSLIGFGVGHTNRTIFSDTAGSP